MVAIIGVMIVALVLVVAGDGGDPVAATTSSSTPTATPSSTSMVATTSTTSADGDARVREVEAILEDLQTRRFQAIYEQDLQGLEMVTTGLYLRGSLEAIKREVYKDYTAEPQAVGVGIEVVEILADRSDCLVVLQSIDLSLFTDSAGPLPPDVDVLWPSEGGWQLVKSWTSKAEFDQEADCDLAIRE